MSGIKDTQWFLDRLPSQATISKYERSGVDALVKTTMDRAVVDCRVTPFAREGVDPKAVAAAMTLAFGAAAKVTKDGADAQLDDNEKAALELFILVVSRPAFLIHRDCVRDTTVNEWTADLDTSRLMIPTWAQGVGRIERAGAPCGTGFLVGDRRVLTNNHVVSILLGQRAPFWRLDPDRYADACMKTAELWKGAEPIIDMVREAGSTESVTARITRVVAHHTSADVAVLELDAMPDRRTRLALATEEPPEFVGSKLFVLGYPMEARETPEVVMRRIFGGDPNVLAMKRLSPGTVMRWHTATPNVFLHDASTLGGSSGSCVIDIGTNKVVGIHFAGLYKTENDAVALWRLKSVLVDAGVEFKAP